MWFETGLSRKSTSSTFVVEKNPFNFSTSLRTFQRIFFDFKSTDNKTPQFFDDSNFTFQLLVSSITLSLNRSHHTICSKFFPMLYLRNPGGPFERSFSKGLFGTSLGRIGLKPHTIDQVVLYLSEIQLFDTF